MATRKSKKRSRYDANTSSERPTKRQKIVLHCTETLCLPSFDWLPPEMKLHIFSFLPESNLLSTVSLVSKEWRTLAEAQLAQRLLGFGFPVEEIESLKSAWTCATPQDWEDRVEMDVHELFALDEWTDANDDCDTVEWVDGSSQGQDASHEAHTGWVDEEVGDWVDATDSADWYDGGEEEEPPLPLRDHGPRASGACAEFRPASKHLLVSSKA